MRNILFGVSTRHIKALKVNDIKGMSRSSISRLWIKKAQKLVEEQHRKDLSQIKPLVLMLDAVILAKNVSVTTAIAVDNLCEAIFHAKIIRN